MATQTTLAGASAPAQEASQASQPQIRVQFTTKHEDISLPESTGQILLPTNLRRYGLSTLVNHLLGTPRPTPLDFLISGSFLRTSIDDYLTANGLSSETTLTLEYVRALSPPRYRSAFEHDDWVSSVDVLSATSPVGLSSSPESTSTSANQARILSGSYDGLLRVWDASTQQLLATSTSEGQGHASSVKAAKFLSPSSVASSSLDRTVRIWKYKDQSSSTPAGESAPPAASSLALTLSLELLGHRSSVDALAVYPASNRILTGSTDTTLCLWSSRKAEGPTADPALIRPTPAPNAKRRKTASDPSIAQRGPLATLTGHSSPVSSVLFPAEHKGTVAYSASWDHSLRTWDLETSTSVDTRSTSSSLLSLSAIPTVNAVAAGSSARHIVLIDPRASATAVAAMTLKGHRGAVVSLAQEPAGDGAGYGLVSGSHDGTCRIWDVRSRRSGVGDAEGTVGESVYTIERQGAAANKKGDKPAIPGEGIKVFGVAWDQDVGIVSGGEDKRVQVNRAVDTRTTE